MKLQWLSTFLLVSQATATNTLRQQQLQNVTGLACTIEGLINVIYSCL